MITNSYDQVQCQNVEDFERGFVAGQLCVYVEQILAGAKLAAQIGCHKRHIEYIQAAAKAEGCKVIIDNSRSLDRAAVWIFKHEFVERLIDTMSQEKNHTPNALEVWMMGKLFGYSDCAISKYLAQHGLI